MHTVSIFKNGNIRAIRLPRDLDFEGGASWRSSGKGTASFCVPSGRPGARSRSSKKLTRTLWWSAGTLSAMKDRVTCEQNVYDRHQYRCHSLYWGSQ